MKHDRSDKPRGKPGAAPNRAGGARKPPRTFSEPGGRRPPSATRPAPERDAADPYQPARRPYRDFARDGSQERFARGERKPRPPVERGGYGERSGRGFTVTLDPDVARVFRGDASVNRALRLVLQLMQVVQGPPKPRGDRAPRGYQGSPEARGFTRKPRFEEDEDGDDGTE